MLYYPVTLTSPAIVMTKPSTFCAMLSILVTVADKWARTSTSHHGVISEPHLVMALTEHLPNPEELTEIPSNYRRLLEDSTICCSLGDGQMFFPAALPYSTPVDLDQLTWSENVFVRVFELPHVSSLFWNTFLVLLARELDKVILQHYQDEISISGESEQSYLSSHMMGTARRVTQFWRQGVFLCIPEVCQVIVCPAKVEASERPVSPGIEVTVEGLAGRLHIKLLHVITHAVVMVSCHGHLS